MATVGNTFAITGCGLLRGTGNEESTVTRPVMAVPCRFEGAVSRLASVRTLVMRTVAVPLLSAASATPGQRIVEYPASCPFCGLASFTKRVASVVLGPV